jgi:hypothetical protein
LISPKEQVFNNLSYQFGYQLAGASNGEEQLMTSCNNIAALDHDKWRSIGLVPSNVQSMSSQNLKLPSLTDTYRDPGPLCNLSHAVPNTTYATTNSIWYNSKIFTTQLLNSFNGTDRFDTLCNRLEIDLLEYFPVIGESVKEAVCQASTLQLAPEPEANPIPGNPAAVKAAKNTASIIYAILVAAGATTDTELNLNCAHAPDYISSLNKIHLNGTMVESTMCEIKKPIAAAEVRSMLRTWMTRYYITIVENISEGNTWLSWLCDNVDIEKMNAVGLSGKAVQYRVCNDAAATTAL